MKRLQLILVLLVACISMSHAQLLWKITGKGLKEPSYIFGTHHLIPIQFLDSIHGLYPAFNSAKTVVSELVLNNIDASPKIQKAALLPDTVTIQSLLSKADYDFANEEIKNTMRMSLDNMNKMHPSLIATIYELGVYKTSAHFDENTKSDSYFQLVAAQKGIPVVGLETVDKQIDLLFPKDLKKEAQRLVETVRNKTILIKELTEMNSLYRCGNIDELEKLSEQSNTQWKISDEESKAMIDDRNIEWVKQLPDLMKKNSCFVAVGALHLPGINGVLHLLKKEGYKVTAVK